LVCVYAFILCLGRGHVTSWSPIQGVLPSVKMISETEKSALCSKVGARGEKILLYELIWQNTDYMWAPETFICNPKNPGQTWRDGNSSLHPPNMFWNNWWIFMKMGWTLWKRSALSGHWKHWTGIVRICLFILGGQTYYLVQRISLLLFV
jgi:hypothetical protein